jgi:hypothetical protein
MLFLRLAQPANTSLAPLSAECKPSSSILRWPNQGYPSLFSVILPNRIKDLGEVLVESGARIARAASPVQHGCPWLRPTTTASGPATGRRRLSKNWKIVSREDVAEQ